MRISNKRVGFNYEVLSKYEAGIELNGFEARGVRHGDVDLSRSFAKIIGHEAYLINASISAHGEANFDPRRTRKLLLHKYEIVEIETKMKQKKLTLVPTSLYTKGQIIKAEIALARTKREFEKKAALKKRDLEREIK